MKQILTHGTSRKKQSEELKTKSTKSSLFSIKILNTKELSMNRNDLLASTLVGLTWKNPVLDSLAVQHLNNQININTFAI